MIGRRDLIKGGVVGGASLAVLRAMGGRVVPTVRAQESPGLTEILQPATIGNGSPERGDAVQLVEPAPPPTTPPPPPPPPKRWAPGMFVASVAGDVPRLALTFDDGPSPYNTEPVLRALEAAGATATFFLIGVNVRAWPEIARRVRDAGHELGNHSVYHTPYRAAALAAQVGPNQEIIHAATGIYPVVSRAPGLTRGWQILTACAQHGMYEVHTDRDTNDWRSPRRSAGTLFAEFQRVLHPGLIGLYHDGGPSRPTPTMVPWMTSYAAQRGYEMTSVTAMVNAGTPIPGVGHYRHTPPDDGSAGDQADGGVGYGDADQVTITCNYDARAELLRRLDDPHVSAAERSRIVEVLADLDQLATED